MKNRKSFIIRTIRWNFNEILKALILFAPTWGLVDLAFWNWITKSYLVTSSSRLLGQCCLSSFWISVNSRIWRFDFSNSVKVRTLYLYLTWPKARPVNSNGLGPLDKAHVLTWNSPSRFKLRKTKPQLINRLDQRNLTRVGRNCLIRSKSIDTAQTKPGWPWLIGETCSTHSIKTWPDLGLSQDVNRADPSRTL